MELISEHLLYVDLNLSHILYPISGSMLIASCLFKRGETRGYNFPLVVQSAVTFTVSVTPCGTYGSGRKFHRSHRGTVSLHRRQM